MLVGVGSTNRQVYRPLMAERRRSALNLSYDEEPMPDINPEEMDFRVGCGNEQNFKCNPLPVAPHLTVELIEVRLQI